MAIREFVCVSAGNYEIHRIDPTLPGYRARVGIVRRVKHPTRVRWISNGFEIMEDVWMLTKAGGVFEYFDTLAEIHQKYPMSNYPGYQRLLDPARNSARKPKVASTRRR